MAMMRKERFWELDEEIDQEMDEGKRVYFDRLGQRHITCGRSEKETWTDGAARRRMWMWMWMDALAGWHRQAFEGA